MHSRNPWPKNPFRAASRCGCWAPLSPAQCSARWGPPGLPGRTRASPFAIGARTRRSGINALRPARRATATRPAWGDIAEALYAARPRLAAGYAATCDPTRIAVPAAITAATSARRVAVVIAPIWPTTSTTAEAAALGVLTLVNSRMARVLTGTAPTLASQALSTATGSAHPWIRIPITAALAATSAPGRIRIAARASAAVAWGGARKGGAAAMAVAGYAAAQQIISAWGTV
jgi:hypothetical protein